MNRNNINDGRTVDAKEHSDDTVSTLMNLAGPRAAIPADIERRVHDEVYKHWQRVTRTKNIARWAVPASLAAMLLIVFAFNIRTPDIAPQTIGVVAYVTGSRGSAGADFTVGNAVLAGDIVETGPDAGVSLTLADDISLRIAAGSSVRLDQADEITLFDGSIYADSGERIYRDRHLTVNTANGSATDIGTQFSVTNEGTRMSVAVREGRVDIAHEQSVITAEAGDKLIVQTGSDVIVDQVAPYDPSWNWASSLAPDFDIKNRSLLDFLKWAARETGKSLSFSSDEVRMAAMGTQVVGSINKFTPDEAIEAVLSTTQFEYEIDKQSINIRK
jgi:hypothetical protein